MADTTNALALALLKREPQRLNPLLYQGKYGQSLIEQGSSTAPVRSPLEGLARALTGAVGGFVAHDAIQQQKDQEQATTDSLTKLAGAKTPEEFQSVLGGIKGGDSEVLAPFLAQVAAQNQAQFGRSAAASAFEKGFTPGGNGGTAITVTPKAGGPAPEEYNNNGSNIRASSFAFPGKGQPYNGFETFGNAQDGANAHVINYREYIKQNPNITVGQALAKWSPPNENNTNAVIQQVAVGNGIDPNTKLSDVLSNPEVATKMLTTQTNLEKGPQVGGRFTPQMFAQALNPNGAPSGTPNPNAQGDTTEQPQAPPSTTSEPPIVPKPTPTPEQIQRQKALMNAPNGISLEQANQNLNKELTDQWHADQTRALEIWKDQQSSKRQTEAADVKLRQEGPLTMIKDRVGNYETKIRPGAMAAVNDIASINQVRQVLDAGAFTGTGAGAKQALGKLGELVGIPAEQAQNTQVLGSVLAKKTLAGAGGSLGTGFSNADRDFMEKAQGGQITLDEGAIRRILDIGERQSRQTIKQHDQEAGRVMKLPGVAQLGGEQFQIPPAPSYEEFNKANPLAPLQTSPTAPQAQAPASVSDGATATNKAGQRIILKDGQWVPLQ